MWFTIIEYAIEILITFFAMQKVINISTAHQHHQLFNIFKVDTVF